MGVFIDLTGKRFGRWTVIRKSLSIGNGTKPSVHWECLCDCGEKREVMGSSLRSGVSQSCGCLQRKRVAEVNSVIHRKHGGTRKDRLYRVWRGMIDRCYYPSHNRYSDYGGRGIFVCEEWRRDYTAFRNWALVSGYDANAPRGECTIDRINVNGPYAPWNCRWVDSITQASNKRNITKAGEF
ncbi:hypothetical protein [Brevibacillus laterosporus]|uniref:AP2 domain-containing protein n=1 Tax=Brevibacillus laterosporus TaxID=1465 RepID=A0AAP3GCA4_BRELA|nr:hypothetical protein [Brevibacillus laterosporus]MCR8978718.1 hypothetical protein [Brevibacillus laterosporus]MCZ0805874.1 hypothetical protein [Brevibacillus laterosporus]MCZ0824360.1 hypothetical protein [Brevibacillus laterosporus]MCZ0848264.1 hypothetical protein [Brevibacillus laterosporus]